MAVNFEQLDTASFAKLDEVYPIGSIYMSINNTDPGTLFGGTWVAWGSGRVPVSVLSTDDDLNAAEKTGGEKEHVLTVDELAAHAHEQDPHTHQTAGHTHSFDGSTSANGDHNHTGRYSGASTELSSSGYFFVRRVDAGDGYDGTSQVTNNAGSHTHTMSGDTQSADVTVQNTTATNHNTGGGNGHNNMQPYITCYMWKRTE